MYEIAVSIVLLTIGLIVVFKSAEKSITSALNLSRLLGISELTVGFVLFSVATSIPELVVGVSSAARGATDLAVGNVFGANIVNVSFVLGVCAVLEILAINRRDVKELVMVLLATSLVSLLFVVYQPGRYAGAALLLLFLAYVYWMLTKSNQAREKAGRPRTFDVQHVLEASAPFAFWIALVILGSQLAVDNAIKLSELLGITKTVIGATLVAMGTTLPELSVSVTAALRGKTKVAMGNAVGSAITNLTLVFGASLLVYPEISFAPAVRLIVFSVIANIVLLYFVVIKGKLDKRDGLLLILGYLAFFVLQFAGG